VEKGLSLMSECPKCSLEGLEWVKTKNNKWWLKNPEGEWHDCEEDKKFVGKKKEEVFSADIVVTPFTWIMQPIQPTGVDC